MLAAIRKYCVCKCTQRVLSSGSHTAMRTSTDSACLGMSQVEVVNCCYSLFRVAETRGYLHGTEVFLSTCWLHNQNSGLFFF